MKREAKLLLAKACDSLVLSIELFNRPSDRGRSSGTLIQIDHSFEMLMKAAILQRGGRIRDNRINETIGFDTCVGRSLSDGDIRYLTEEQADVLRAINSLRDAAQHHLLDISEGQLYLQVQAGFTLFRDLLKSVFGQELASHLPTRVLPISTSLPTDIVTLFESQVAEIKKLLVPGRRRRIDALARLRPLALLDGAIRGKKEQPSDRDLERLGKDILAGKAWDNMFPGAAVVEIAADGVGPSLSLRFSKKEGMPMHSVPEGTPGATAVVTKRVDERGFYSLSATSLAEKLKLSKNKLVAIIDVCGLRKNEDYYKEFKFGKVVHKCYSQKIIKAIETELSKRPLDDIWADYRKLIKQRQPHTS